MNILTQKLIQSFTVLHYYYLIDNTKGRSLEQVPEHIRSEVEILANERYVNEYLARVGELDNGI
ncbi:hypothetical protein CIW83_18470 [Tissierella sp. P1]|uniref:hypothetical protein n=1 Tax=Tissierella sp. P1 TaxID=1280483 RepID=UPI000B9FB788|nr:hypothetical protein [Tissierella sp. P1]OZV10803.1 hypothetical protein CIW83_18470 [Tissierella sp. P1]